MSNPTTEVLDACAGRSLSEDDSEENTNDGKVLW